MLNYIQTEQIQNNKTLIFTQLEFQSTNTISTPSMSSIEAEHYEYSCLHRKSRLIIILKIFLNFESLWHNGKTITGSVIEVKHRPIEIVLGWGTERMLSEFCA